MLIQVITSTTREGRFGDKVARWVIDHLSACGDLDVELIDLREFPLPFFDGLPPARAPREYSVEEVGRLGRAIDRADGYVVLTAEYNHGYPAVLKNAMDWTFVEWRRKPIAFVGWGNVGGARHRATATGRGRIRDGSAAPCGAHPAGRDESCAPVQGSNRHQRIRSDRPQAQIVGRGSGLVGRRPPQRARGERALIAGPLRAFPLRPLPALPLPSWAVHVPGRCRFGPFAFWAVRVPGRSRSSHCCRGGYCYGRSR